MKLADFKKSGDYVRVTFARGEDRASKYVPFGDPKVKAVYGDAYRKYELLELQKAATEANRDMIVREVGVGDARNHPDWNQRFPDLAVEIAAKFT